MSSTINTRISYLINQLKLSKSDFAKSLGTSSARISNITNGRNKPDSDILARIKNVFKVNGDWLLDGEGPIFKGRKDKSIVLPDLEKLNYRIKEGVKKIQDLDLEIKGISFVWLENSKYGDNLEAELQAIPKQAQEIFITVESTGEKNISFVPISEHVNYLSNYKDPHSLQTLPSFTIPGFQDKLYRAFEIENDTNLQFATGNFSKGDIFIGTYIKKIENIQDNNIYVIIADQGLLITKCINRLGTSGVLICSSGNQNNHSPTIFLESGQIKEVWEFKALISLQVPNMDPIIRHKV